jgi:hypothetical protein
MRAADLVTLTTTQDAAAGSYYVHMETRAEAALRRSNENADRALMLGCRGFDTLAEIHAEMADMCADSVRIYEFLETI